MKNILGIILILGLNACSEATPKTGAMPGIATAGYDAPTNAEASAAYMGAFQARYNIPELDYPEDIKIRIKKARLKQLQRDMRVVEKRQKVMATLTLQVLAMNDTNAKKALDDIKKNPSSAQKDTAIDWMTSIMDNQQEQLRLPKAQREIIYKKTITDYAQNFRALEIETCRWTKMRRLIGSGHEAMAYTYGDHPTHGYECSGDMKTERNKGYPRKRSFRDFWVKSPSGEWLYYGQFRGVGIAPRKQQLNPELLKNPEAYIARKNSWDWVASQLN